MTAAARLTTTLLSLPSAQFRRSATFYRTYDTFWLIASLVGIAALHAFQVQQLTPSWSWWFLAAFPVVIYVHIVANVFVHNACHGNFPKSVNRLVGEILGFVVLSRFASWQIIHARHHMYSDDPERDPHPIQARYWPFVFQSIMGIEKQLQKSYLEAHGDTEENRRRERVRAWISYSTNIAVVAFWFTLLGPAGFFFFYVPATILGWLFVMHFNWVTHNVLAKDGDFHPVNLDHGYFWLGNRIFFGIYMHENHHRRANVFNPLHMPPERAPAEPAS
jgi:stearoyl-CoA desaturase (delta-9 desaturase)